MGGTARGGGDGKYLDKAQRRKERDRKRKENANGQKSKKGNANANGKGKDAYSMKKIAELNLKEKELPVDDLFTSLDDIASKIKKDVHEKKRIVYSSTNNKHRF